MGAKTGRAIWVNWNTYLKWLVLIVSISCFFLLFCLSFHHEVNRAGWISASVLVLTIGLWITEYLPMAVTGLLGCFFLYVSGMFFHDKLLINHSFTGFASPTVWFVFSALIIGTAMGVSGLARRLSLIFLRFARNSYHRVILGYIALCALLVFLLPSTDARTVTLMSFAIGMTDFQHGTLEQNLMKSLSILVPISSGVMGIGVIAGVSSITAVGLIEKYLGLTISYGKWLILFLPAEILSITTLFFLVTRIFPCQLQELDTVSYVQHELSAMGPTSKLEKRTAIIISATVIMWLIGPMISLPTDAIAMTCAGTLLIPYIGVIDGKTLAKKVNWLIAPIFLGTALSIIDCLNSTGMLGKIGDFLLNYISNPLGNGRVLSKMFIISGLSGSMHLLTAHSSMLIISFLPVILHWTSTFHLGLDVPLIFVWGSQYEILFYQSSSLTIAYGYGAITQSDLLKIALPLVLVEFIGGTLLLYGWWNLLGII